jgi:hypothetical protein
MDLKIEVSGIPFKLGQKVSYLSSPIPPNSWRVGTVCSIFVRQLMHEEKWDVVYSIELDEPLNHGKFRVGIATPDCMKAL